jgi:hypothetical protein
MPRSEVRIPIATAQVRTLQARLPQLSVPALLRVRDALEPVLDSDTIRVSDVTTVLRAADGD